MQKLCVFMEETPGFVEGFQSIFLRELEDLPYYDLSYDWRIYEDEDGHFFEFRSWPHREHDIESLEALRHSVSKALVIFIKRYKEQQWLRNILTDEFDLSQSEEVRAVLDYARVMMEGGEEEERENSERPSFKEDPMFRELFDFFSHHHYLDMEGFCRFRLQTYRSHLRSVAEKCMDDYQVEKEYQKFIQLLQYFVSLQKPKLPLLHIVHYDERKFKLYDENFSIISPEDVKHLTDDLQDLDEDGDDMIVSTLMTIAPKRIVLHTQAPVRHIIRTIVRIFKDKIDICSSGSSCRLCRTGKAPSVQRKE